MADDACDWMTETVRLPEFASLLDVYKKLQLAQCEQFCPDHACSFAEQNRAFNQFILT